MRHYSIEDPILDFILDPFLPPRGRGGSMYGGVGLMLLLFVFLQTGEAQTGAAIAVRLSAPEAAASPATVAMWPGQESRQVAIPGKQSLMSWRRASTGSR